MSGCLPCTKLRPELSLLNECYPPPKALLQAGPDYRPLSQDLSKLTYSAKNKSSLLPKIGDELEKRVVKEAARSTGGYTRYRASLLISLAILKTLIIECKSDLALFSRPIIRIVSIALDVKVYQQNTLDLEVAGRAASSFIAFCTFTDGNSLASDPSLSSTYLTVLRKFGVMAIDRGIRPSPANSNNNEKQPSDSELRNRTRLIALAALNGAASSDALFSSVSEFPKQVNLIVPPLMSNVFEGTMSDLKLQTAKIEMDASPSPFFSEFSARRPVNDRRAPSLHAHIPGEKGPLASDVIQAAQRLLRALLAQCQVTQASHVLDAVFVFLDGTGWTDVERCCWLAERSTAAMSLQYRFVVPTKIVELLMDMPDGPVTHKHTTALAMVTTILNSHTSLVGLAVTDLCNSLTTLIIRRIHRDPHDALLPPLVQCISSLGTHIYYSDQINDVVEEIAIRISQVPQADKERAEILRVLIHCISGLMTTARLADESEARLAIPFESGDKGKAPQLDTPLEVPRLRTGRRNPISPEVWQETLALLCESSFPVRAAYARALLLYLEHEIPKGKSTVRPNDMTGFRFCNALYAAIYTLAMSSCLGPGSPDPSPSATPSQTPQPVQLPQIDQPTRATSPVVGSKEKGVKFDVAEPTLTINDSPSHTSNTDSPTPKRQSTGPGVNTPPLNGTSTPPKKTFRASRRVSLPLNRLNSSAVLSSHENVATPFDFSFILAILNAVHTALPVPALITGIPMLLALDRDAGQELVRRTNDGRAGAWVLERKRAIRETVCLAWEMVGKKWNIQQVVDIANATLNLLPEPLVVPTLRPKGEGILPGQEETAPFYPFPNEGETSATSLPLIDPDNMLVSLSGAVNVQNITGREATALLKRWKMRWTVEGALKDSVERFSSANIHPTPDAHLDIARVLMTADNASFQSLSRPIPRPIDVTDLREALGGRAASIDGSAPPSLTSLDTRSGSRAQRGGEVNGNVNGRSRSGEGGKRGQADVKEVLKEIFKDRRKAAQRAEKVI